MTKAHRTMIDLTHGYEVIAEYDKYGWLQDVMLYHDQQEVCKLVERQHFSRYPQGAKYATFLSEDRMRVSCMRDDLRFCFSYVSKIIQGGADSDGFGMEPDERIYEYVILDGQGNFISHATCRKPEGYGPFLPL